MLGRIGRRGRSLQEVHQSAMNRCVPGWSMEDDSRSFHDLLPSASYRKSTWPENELVELLWQNGQVVMHAQTNRKTMDPPNETKQCQKPESASRSGEPLRNSANIVQEETASWFQYPIDDPLEKEFGSDFFYGLQTTEPSPIDKLKDVISGNKFAELGAPEENSMLSESVFEQSDILQFGENIMPAASEVVASFPQPTSEEDGGFRKVAHFSRPLRGDSGSLNQHCGEKSLGNQIQREIGESSSMTTKESSICGSNQVQNRVDVSCSNTVTVVPAQVVKEDAQTGFSHERVHTDMRETTITSSSDGSGCTIGRKGDQSARTRIHKRKGRDADESEFQSEEAEYESIETNRKAEKSASARRKRAAEVHNLSERRRRDRINEKMRALQELIPHCNKSDKASMLDDAIEYLKSLQLQLQVMWMGSGTTPMMFPGVHHYIPQIMSMGHGSMPPIHGPILFPRVPLIKQSVSLNPAVKQTTSCPPSGTSPINYQNQMQMPSSYASWLGFHHMQLSPQMTNLYAYGSQSMQQNQTALAARSFAPCDGGAPSKNSKNDSVG